VIYGFLNGPKHTVSLASLVRTRTCSSQHGGEFVRSQSCLQDSSALLCGTQKLLAYYGLSIFIHIYPTLSIFISYLSHIYPIFIPYLSHRSAKITIGWYCKYHPRYGCSDYHGSRTAKKTIKVFQHSGNNKAVSCRKRICRILYLHIRSYKYITYIYIEYMCNTENIEHISILVTSKVLR
jgi:hypothetical protein